LLLIGCILYLRLFVCLLCVRIHGPGHRSTLKNRRDVGFREKDSSANSPVLDAVIADDTPERLAADLEHRRRLFGRVNFHQRGMATG
jgi:hypothetical protein